MHTVCVAAMALVQPGQGQGPTRPPLTTRMRPTGTTVRPTLRPPPDDGTRRDDCDATLEEINNCNCDITRDDDGCPECPDNCPGELRGVELCWKFTQGCALVAVQRQACSYTANFTGLL